METFKDFSYNPVSRVDQFLWVLGPSIIRLQVQVQVQLYSLGTFKIKSLKGKKQMKLIFKMAGYIHISISKNIGFTVFISRSAFETPNELERMCFQD